MKYRCFALVALLAVPLVSAQSQVWAQCGVIKISFIRGIVEITLITGTLFRQGMSWSGATTCVSESVCTKLNDWYFRMF